MRLHVSCATSLILQSWEEDQIKRQMTPVRSVPGLNSCATRRWSVVSSETVAGVKGQLLFLLIGAQHRATLQNLGIEYRILYIISITQNVNRFLYILLCLNIFVHCTQLFRKWDGKCFYLIFWTAMRLMRQNPVMQPKMDRDIESAFFVVTHLEKERALAFIKRKEKLGTLLSSSLRYL